MKPKMWGLLGFLASGAFRGLSIATVGALGEGHEDEADKGIGGVDLADSLRALGLCN